MKSPSNDGKSDMYPPGELESLHDAEPCFRDSCPSCWTTRDRHIALSAGAALLGFSLITRNPGALAPPSPPCDTAAVLPGCVVLTSDSTCSSVRLIYGRKTDVGDRKRITLDLQDYGYPFSSPDSFTIPALGFAADGQTTSVPWRSRETNDDFPRFQPMRRSANPITG